VDLAQRVLVFEMLKNPADDARKKLDDAGAPWSPGLGLVRAP
jgi:hypothetical protein